MKESLGGEKKSKCISEYRGIEFWKGNKPNSILTGKNDNKWIYHFV